MSNKKTTHNSPARRAAFCGIIAALTMVILWLGGLTVLDLSALVLCSLITILVAIETGAKTGWLYAAVTSSLALILLPSKFYAVQFIMFSAVYPLIIPVFNRLPRLAALACRVAVLDTMLLGCVLLGRFVFTAGDQFFGLSVLTFLLGTAFFLLYDFALSRCIAVYLVKLRNKINLSRFL